MGRLKVPVRLAGHRPLVGRPVGPKGRLQHQEAFANHSGWGWWLHPHQFCGSRVLGYLAGVLPDRGQEAPLSSFIPCSSGFTLAAPSLRACVVFSRCDVVEGGVPVWPVLTRGKPPAGGLGALELLGRFKVYYSNSREFAITKTPQDMSTGLLNRVCIFCPLPGIRHDRRLPFSSD